MRSERRREASRSNGRASGDLAALDRCERRALSRRTFAIREFDAARPALSRVSSRQFGRTNPTRGRRATFWPNEPKGCEGCRSGVSSLAKRTQGHRPAGEILAKRTQGMQVEDREFVRTNPTGTGRRATFWPNEPKGCEGCRSGVSSLAKRTQGHRPAGEISAKRTQGVQVEDREFGQTNPTGAATAGNIWAGETRRVRIGGRYFGQMNHGRSRSACFGQTNPRPNQRAQLAQTKHAQRAISSGEASRKPAEGDRWASW
jgi:hypothetical protein